MTPLLLQIPFGGVDKSSSSLVRLVSGRPRCLWCGSRRPCLGLDSYGRTREENAGGDRGVGWQGVQLANLLFQISNPHAQHLVFPREIGRLGLVEGTFVTQAVPPRRTLEKRRRRPVAASSETRLVSQWSQGGRTTRTGLTPGYASCGRLWHRRWRPTRRMDRGEGDGTFRGRGLVVVENGGTAVVAHHGRGGPRLMGIALRITKSVELELLFSDHLQHSVHLCLLLLLQLVVNFAQARLALVVGVARGNG